MDDGLHLPLVHAGEVPEERLYAKLAEQDGRVRGEWRRRRDAEFHLWELPGGTVVRWQRVVDDAIVEDHLQDAGGGPLVTVYPGDRAVVASVPPAEVPLAGWSSQRVPDGTMLLPSPPGERPGGGVRLEVLGGTLEVWREAPVDVFADAFGASLAAGCGCVVLDRASAWVGHRPGVRYRLLVPGPTPEAVDVWAVPQAGSTWVLAFRAPAPADPVPPLLPARVLVAGTVFEAKK